MSKVIRVSDEVFSRLLKRDPHPQRAIARLAYLSLALDDPLEAAHVYGYLSDRTYATLKYYGHFKTIRGLLDWTNEEIRSLRHIGVKAIDEVQRLRAHFRYNLRVERKEVRE